MSDITFEDKCAEIKEKKQQMMDKMIEYYAPMVRDIIAFRNEEIEHIIESRNKSKPIGLLDKIFEYIYVSRESKKRIYLCEIKYKKEFGDENIFYNMNGFIYNIGKEISKVSKERYNLPYDICFIWERIPDEGCTFTIPYICVDF